MSWSFAFTSSSRQKYSCRPCTHSKYETTTSPALASTSGRTRTSRSSRIASADVVTGPFAPSQMTVALMRSAFSSVTTCSSAHGARMSQGSSRSSSFVTASAFARPATMPRSCLCASAAGTSMPLALLARQRLDVVERAARRRLLAAERAADRERLARDDPEHRVALVHRVGVEDPGHDAAVGADVRRRDVPLRPDVVDDLARVAPSHVLELVR